MKVKLKWRYVYTDWKNTNIAHEAASTPFGDIVIRLGNHPDEYREPYRLIIPGRDPSTHESIDAAKAAAATYLNSKLPDFIDTTT